MSSKVTESFNHHCWSQVWMRAKNAVVFVDAAMAECLHWAGGFLKVLDEGALDVKEFAAFERGGDDQHKALFLLSTCIQGPVFMTLRDVVKSSSFKHCIVMTAASTSVHHWAKFGGRAGEESIVFDELETQLLQWMGSMNFLTEVLHCPLFVANVGSHLFVTPPFAKLFPPMDCDLERIASIQRVKQKISDRRPLESLADVDYLCFSLELQVAIKQFVSGFNQLLGAMNAREDIFTLGHLSRILGSELEAYAAAKTRRKTAANKVSVLFMDRTLDLVTPTSHLGDTLMDKMQCLLSRLPNHANDVAIDMSVLSGRKDMEMDPNVLAPGCLAHPENSKAWLLLDSTIVQKQKDCLLEIHRQLVTCQPSQEKNKPVRRVSPEVLESLASSFATEPDLIEANSGLLELAVAASQTLKHPGKSKMDQLLGVEKVLVQNLGIAEEEGSEGPSVLHQVSQLVLSRRERCLSLEDLLVLLVHVYGLLGQEGRTDLVEEGKLKGFLAEAMMADFQVLGQDIKDIIGSPIDEMTVHRAVEKVFLKLQSIRDARAGLKKYRSILKPGGFGQPASSTGILEQLMADILHPNRPELTDVECRSTGLKDLLKTGFSLFLNVSRPHPLDNPTLIIYVIGGITAGEVCHIKEMVKSTSTNVIVGSTRMLNPNDMISQVFVLDPLQEIR